MIVSVVEIINQAWSAIGSEAGASLAEALRNRAQRRRVLAIAQDALASDTTLPGSTELKELLREEWFVSLLADPSAASHGAHWDDSAHAELDKWMRAVPDPEARRRGLVAVLGAVWSVAASDASLSEKLQLSLLRQVDNTTIHLVNLGLDTFDAVQDINQRVADLVAAVGALGVEARRDVVEAMPEYLQELRRQDWERLTHGLRTVIQSATSNVQYVRHRLPEANRLPELTSMLDVGIAHLEEVGRLVARVTLRGDQLRVVDIDPHDVIERASHRVAQFARATGDRVEVRVLQAPHMVVRTSPEALDLAVHETVLNAVQWASLTETKPKVVVSCRTTGDRLIVCVSDNGPGFGSIDPNLPFSGWRSELARRRRPSGSGVSLRVVRSLLRSSGGDVTIDCSAVGGAVEITLPVAAP